MQDNRQDMESVCEIPGMPHILNGRSEILDESIDRERTEFSSEVEACLEEMPSIAPFSEVYQPASWLSPVPSKIKRIVGAIDEPKTLFLLKIFKASPHAIPLKSLIANEQERVILHRLGPLGKTFSGLCGRLKKSENPQIDGVRIGLSCASSGTNDLIVYRVGMLEAGQVDSLELTPLEIAPGRTVSLPPFDKQVVQDMLYHPQLKPVEKILAEYFPQSGSSPGDLLVRHLGECLLRAALQHVALTPAHLTLLEEFKGVHEEKIYQAYKVVNSVLPKELNVFRWAFERTTWQGPEKSNLLWLGPQNLQEPEGFLLRKILEGPPSPNGRPSPTSPKPVKTLKERIHLKTHQAKALHSVLNAVRGKLKPRTYDRVCQLVIAAPGSLTMKDAQEAITELIQVLEAQGIPIKITAWPMGEETTYHMQLLEGNGSSKPVTLEFFQGLLLKSLPSPYPQLGELLFPTKFERQGLGGLIERGLEEMVLADFLGTNPEEQEDLRDLLEGLVRASCASTLLTEGQLLDYMHLDGAGPSTQEGPAQQDSFVEIFNLDQIRSYLEILAQSLKQNPELSEFELKALEFSVNGKAQKGYFLAHGEEAIRVESLQELAEFIREQEQREQILAPKPITVSGELEDPSQPEGIRRYTLTQETPWGTNTRVFRTTLYPGRAYFLTSRIRGEFRSRGMPPEWCEEAYRFVPPTEQCARFYFYQATEGEVLTQYVDDKETVQYQVLQGHWLTEEDEE